MFKRSVIASIAILVIAIVACTAVLVGDDDCKCPSTEKVKMEYYKQGLNDGIELGFERCIEQSNDLPVIEP